MNNIWVVKMWWWVGKSSGGMCLAASDLRGLPPNWASAIRGAVYNIELMCDTLLVCWTQIVCRTFFCFAALCQSWTSCVAILLLGSVTLLVYPRITRRATAATAVIRVQNWNWAASKILLLAISIHFFPPLLTIIIDSNCPNDNHMTRGKKGSRDVVVSRSIDVFFFSYSKFFPLLTMIYDIHYYFHYPTSP